MRRLWWTMLVGMAVLLAGGPVGLAQENRLLVDSAWLNARLGDPQVRLVDMVTDPGAYQKGHIPGAVNIEWSQHLRSDGTFRPIDELRALYLGKGITPDKTVIAYCQTHHRSAHSYFVLRLLAYPKVVGYDRSWSEWGNREDLPIER